MMKRYCTLFLCLWMLSAIAQDHYRLRLKTGEYTVEENFRSFLSNPQLAEESFYGQHYRWVMFNEIPSTEEKAAMKNAGLELLQYLPNNTFMASIKNTVDWNALTNYEIRSIFAPGKEYKMQSRLLQQDYPEWALQEEGKIDLVLTYYNNLKPAYVTRELETKGVEVLSQYDFSWLINVRVALDQIDELVNLPFISYVECVPMPPTPDNLEGRTLHRSNTLNTSYSAGNKYDGTGYWVAMGDDGIIGPHIDYEGRLDQSNVDPGTDKGNHGDHIAGTIMGAGNLDPTTQGMAPGAELMVYFNQPSSNDASWEAANNVPTTYHNPGVRITSTSYSSTCNDGYTSHAASGDQATRTLPALMHVFSAGNSGTANCGYGNSAPKFGNITGGIKMGKNCLTVGNVDYKDLLHETSSRGPATDGRIKPDVCAMGEWVYSTFAGNRYGTKLGTSMATPGVAGTVVQLSHAAKELNGGTEQESGLIKAIILNTCDDIERKGPDFNSGWGRINAYRAFKLLEDNQYIKGSISQGGSENHTISVPAGTKEVRIMCYWTDYEGAANANPALVNDIDIVVKDPSNTEYQPWVLDHSPYSSMLKALPVRKEDRLNNVEQVTVEDPAAGDYTVTIDGYAIPQGPQTYYIVYEFRNEEVALTYPIGGEGFVPGETESIRWNAMDNGSTFTLEYSTDNGSTWKSIASSIASDDLYYDWTVPSELTGEAMVKVTRGANSDQSDAAFSIIQVPESLEVTWACPTLFRMDWDAVPGATSYEAFLLGNKYMESQGTTSDTYFEFSNNINDVDEYWVSVRALGPNGAIGRRAIAIVKDPGTFSCPPGAGIVDAIAKENIILYPNPTTDIATLKISNAIGNAYLLRVTDLQGRLVLAQQLTGNSQELKTTIDLQNFSKGTYIIRLYGEGEIFRTKLNKL